MCLKQNFLGTKKFGWALPPNEPRGCGLVEHTIGNSFSSKQVERMSYQCSNSEEFL